MGWILKGLVVIVGLLSLSVGFWPLWVPCLGYLAYSLWKATRGRTVVLKDERNKPKARVRRVAFKKRYILSGLSLILSAVAFSQRGTYSPWVFLSIATVITASGLLRRGSSVSRFTPVSDSILLRRRWLPISWVSLAEVKFGTSQISRPLSSVGSEVIMTTSSENMSAYVPIRVLATSAAQAEKKVRDRLAPLARTLSSRGAYLLPLDSKAAASRMSWSLKRVALPLGKGGEGIASLDSTLFDVLVLAPEAHMLESAAAYVIRQGSKAGDVAIPSANGRLESQPLMWEALETLGEKHVPNAPDAYTNFLSSICATRGEGLGDRLMNGGRTDTGTILIGSLGAAEIELTRPQLRAIVSAYG